MPILDSLEIRVAVAADASALAEFAARTFAETFGADNRPEDLRAHLAASFSLAQQTREILDPAVVTMLGFQNHTLVAFAQVRRKPPPACVDVEHPIELQRFYVDRPGHGTGVAQRLMQAARQAARDFDGRHLWLGVWERNSRAIAFYKKVGFTDQGSTDFFVGPDRQTDRVLVAPLFPA
jgi:GNAT superfamily N-acetyltransferase